MLCCCTGHVGCSFSVSSEVGTNVFFCCQCHQLTKYIFASENNIRYGDNEVKYFPAGTLGSTLFVEPNLPVSAGGFTGLTKG